MRLDSRSNDQMRPVTITPNYVDCAEGSVLIEVGKTRVLCNASIQKDVPGWLKNKGKGWVTAEYSLLPRSTGDRVNRERKGAGGRTQEIQRLIGRSLRAVCDLEALGERQIIVDCDVIQADGGTRTASVTGAFIALAHALQFLQNSDWPDKPTKPVLQQYLQAVSVGILNNTPILDLCYQEDSSASVDMNIVFANATRLVEVQGTGEESTFTRGELNELLDLGEKGAQELLTLQKQFVPQLY